MTRIAVEPGALDRWAADTARVRVRLADSLARADVVVTRLDARWEGTASGLFADHYAEWRAATNRLTGTLDLLVTLVDHARTNYRSAAVANDRMWPTATPVVVAMSATTRGIDADPDDFRTTAAVLAGQGERLDGVWHALGTALAGTGGMAGADPPGSAFGFDHDTLVVALWSGWGAARDVVRALVDTVAATGDNLLRAERASTADATSPPDPLPRSLLHRPRQRRRPTPAAGPSTPGPPATRTASLRRRRPGGRQRRH
jgi:WXG100 family type VII secretion target